MCLDPAKDGPLGPNRELGAEPRLRLALDSIQEARRLLDLAAHALSTIAGMRTQQSELGNRARQVHSTWYAVESRASWLRRHRRLVLDHEEGAGEPRDAAQGGEGGR
jgi:hypothetical protein